jgi:hypothetical protein
VPSAPTRGGDEKPPIFAGVSVLLTIGVELLILSIKRELPRAELAAGALGMGMVFVATAASVVNLILARIAHRRGEGWGWRQAVVGIGVWFATIAVVILQRQQ